MTGMKPAFSICVYCGARPGASPEFEKAARLVGHWIGQHQGQLVYGGGNNGLMGMVADATQAAGGRVVGVIPHALAQKDLPAMNAMNCTWWTRCTNENT